MNPTPQEQLERMAAEFKVHEPWWLTLLNWAFALFLYGIMDVVGGAVLGCIAFTLWVNFGEGASWWPCWFGGSFLVAAYFIVSAISDRT